jgi:hypothetical protein
MMKFYKVVFSDEATFHLPGNFNQHNLRIWGSNNSNEVIAHTRDSPKLNMCLTLSKQNVFEPFFFVECTATAIVYLDMLYEFHMSILEEEGANDMLFQQDRAPPLFHREVTDFLNCRFPEKWIGSGGPITHLICLTLLPLIFSFGGYIKDAVNMPPLATTLLELTRRIRDTVATVTLDLLNNMWTVIEYRYDICWATHGALIENL